MSAGTVGAWLFGNLFASGGSVTIHGGQVHGTGSVTAHGRPKITITNNSPDYVVLADGMTIPDLVGGICDWAVATLASSSLPAPGWS